jgi:ComF family protein
MMYQDRGRAIVLKLKHGDGTDIAAPASKWMARAAKPFAGRIDLIVPVPLHRLRLLRRRYNQAALLAKALGAELDTAVCEDALQRPKPTQSQDGKTLSERFANVNAAINLHPRRRHRIAGRTVLIVDDVMTSGATFTACADACLTGGAADVFVLALARVAKEP